MLYIIHTLAAYVAHSELYLFIMR